MYQKRRKETLLPSAPFRFQDLPPKQTLLVLSDLQNGFALEGPLASSRVSDLLPLSCQLLRHCNDAGIASIAFVDSHSEQSTEFTSFPQHCIEQTEEAEICSDLAAIGGFTLMKKNCTNGFFSPDFLPYLAQHSEIEHFVICGCCTDICVLQFAMTLKAYMNQNNRKSHLIIPANLVDTFDDAKTHPADLMNTMSLRLMAAVGIHVVSEVLYGG